MAALRVVFITTPSEEVATKLARYFNTLFFSNNRQIKGGCGAKTGRVRQYRARYQVHVSNCS